MAYRVAYKPEVERAPGRWWLDAIERAASQTAPRLRGAVVVVTSGHDGKHKVLSRHYRDQALDLRFTGDRPGGIDALHYAERMGLAPPPDWVAYVKLQQRIARDGWALELRAVLGRDFDVVYESDHLHVEYDPKPGLDYGAVQGG